MMMSCTPLTTGGETVIVRVSDTGGTPIPYAVTVSSQLPMANARVSEKAPDSGMVRSGPDGVGSGDEFGTSLDAGVGVGTGVGDVSTPGDPDGAGVAGGRK